LLIIGRGVLLIRGINVTCRCKYYIIFLFSCCIMGRRPLFTIKTWKLKESWKIEKDRHQNTDWQFIYYPIWFFNFDFYSKDEFQMLLVSTLSDELRTQCFLQPWLNCGPNIELVNTVLSSDESSNFAPVNSV